jgi:hypothetical protein
MDLLETISYDHDMSERLKRLLAEARAWCIQERGRQSRLAEHLGVSRAAIAAWFAEEPKKQPTAEQALAMAEFLKQRRRESRDQR